MPAPPRPRAFPGDTKHEPVEYERCRTWYMYYDYSTCITNYSVSLRQPHPDQHQGVHLKHSNCISRQIQTCHVVLWIIWALVADLMLKVNELQECVRQGPFEKRCPPCMFETDILTYGTCIHTAYVLQNIDVSKTSVSRRESAKFTSVQCFLLKL